MESVMDMIAEKTGQDPIEMRLAMLDESNEQQARLAGVIREAKKLSDWKKGDKRGFAVHFSFNSYVAVVADVTVKDKVVSFNKLHMAVDCGVPVNPDVIKAQMEGGAGYGLGAMMRNEINFKDGIVQQTNFTDYVPLRISEMPEVEVAIVQSDKAPTGVGEPGLPPTIPAVANAIYAQTGERISALPLTRLGYKFA
jgi:isoquinoline 1-oxidoreductase beta subunit